MLLRHLGRRRVLGRFPPWGSGEQGSGGVQGYLYPSRGLSPHGSCTVCTGLHPSPLQTRKLHEHRTRNPGVCDSQSSSGLRMWVSGASFATSLDVCWGGRETGQSSPCPGHFCLDDRKVPVHVVVYLVLQHRGH